MRTGSPVGGGCGLPGSPSNDLIGKSTGMPNDVEAAIAMVGLSGGFGNNRISPVIVQKSPTSIKSIVFDNVKVEPSDFDDVSKNCDSLSKSVHIKCPVMPERHSFVQKALKRKIENRMEPTMVVVSREHVDDRMTMNANLPERRITPDERDEIVLAKRFRYENEVEQQRQQQHVGRFVRTCQPCHPDDVLKHQQRQLEARQQAFGRKLLHVDSPRESFHRPEMEQNVGRFVRTGQPCQSGDVWKTAHPALIHESGSPVSIAASKSTGLERAAMQQSPDSKYIGSQRYHVIAEELPKPSFTVASPAGQVNGWLSQMSKTYQGPKIQPFIKRTDFSRIPSGSPSGGTMSSSTVGRQQHIQFNHSVVRDNRAAQVEQAERVYCSPGMKAVDFNQQGRKSDNLNALYSLGRYAASVCMPSLRRQPLVRVSDATSAHVVESQLMYSPSKQRFNSAFPKDVHFSRGRSNENSMAVRIARVRNLDVRTERKVSDGEFGSLHSLQMFYNKLSKKPTALESSQTRQPLGAITNKFAVKHEDNEKYTDSWRQINDGVEETALDLSMHSNRAEVDFDNDAMPRPPLPSQIMRRKSRSCCSSPVSGVTMLRRGTRETSTEYIDRLLFLESRSDLFQPDQTTKSTDNATSLPSSPFASQKADDDETAKSSSPSKPNKMLPLKKRRLVEVDDSDKETSSNSRSPASLEYSSMDLKEDMVSSQQLGDFASKSRCIASAVTQPDEDGDLPLHKAVAQRKIGIVHEVIKMMSRIGASLDDYNNLKQTAMHIAVLTDQPDVVRLLLMAGASPNVVDQNGLTSIHHASKLRSSSCLQCIVEYSTDPLDVNAVTYHGLAALHLAVKCGNASAVITLIEAGACVDVRDRANGRTPLFYAVEQNDSRISALLLKCGANPTILTYSGCSPAVAAANTRCSTEVARLLNAYTSADDRCLGSVLPTACLG